MIFESLSLHNYGLYKGLHHLSFTRTDERKNITLIGGLNGAGKTTILEALQIALYGRLAPIAQDSKCPYDQFLQERINRRVSEKDGASVELCFRVQEDGRQHVYTVTRSWTARNGRTKENLSVTIDGKYDEVLTSTWTEHAERFIPARLAPLFFFDGEKIEALADPERSTEAIRTAMEALFGLDLITQLTADLVTLERRKISESSNGNGTESSRVQELEVQYVERRERITALQQNEAAQMNQLDGLNRNFQSVQRKLTSEGGDLFETRKELEAKHAAAVAELGAADDRLREVASGDLPLFLLLTKLQALWQRAQQAGERQHREILKSYIRRHDDQLLAFLESATKISKDLCEAVKGYLAGRFASEFSDQEEQNSYAGLDEKTTGKLSYLLQKLPVDEKDARRLLTEHEKLTIRAQTQERHLSTIPEQDAIASTLAERERIRLELAAAETQLNASKEELVTATKQLEDTKATMERALQQEAIALKEQAEQARLIDHIQKASQTLAVFKQRLIAKRAERLGQLVQESFSHLIRKQGLISEIRIDPANGTLALFDSHREQISPDRLSAGERQLLAVSLLWGMARAAGRPLPIVVDTPLGRLDGTHRLNLVTKYFPFASHQVIVLSTDEEIDGELLEHLKPYIGHSYLLEFMDDLGHSVVRPGYFAETEATA